MAAKSDVIRVSDESTRADIAEAIRHLRAAYLRGPQGRAWQDQHHARLDALLGDWERAR